MASAQVWVSEFGIMPKGTLPCHSRESGNPDLRIFDFSIYTCYAKPHSPLITSNTEERL